jgi:hypothetical protein
MDAAPVMHHKRSWAVLDVESARIYGDTLEAQRKRSKARSVRVEAEARGSGEKYDKCIILFRFRRAP